MSPRRGQLRTGGTRDGLFDGNGQPAELHDNPLQRPCPACHAPAGNDCTRPARGGRRNNHGYHPARLQEATDA